MKWKATHRLSWKDGSRTRRAVVCLMWYGAAYTRREWLRLPMVFSAFARDEAGRWYFRAKPFTGTVERIR